MGRICPFFWLLPSCGDSAVIGKVIVTYHFSDSSADSSLTNIFRILDVVQKNPFHLQQKKQNYRAAQRIFSDVRARPQ